MRKTAPGAAASVAAARGTEKGRAGRAQSSPHLPSRRTRLACIRREEAWCGPPPTSFGGWVGSGPKCLLAIARCTRNVRNTGTTVWHRRPRLCTLSRGCAPHSRGRLCHTESRPTRSDAERRGSAFPRGAWERGKHRDDCVAQAPPPVHAFKGLRAAQPRAAVPHAQHALRRDGSEQRWVEHRASG